ncbi:MAG: hypothetical protein CL479_00455, partial [Acidobacteria bacterium]|nr:hypothetical protein [Acidobacteriota bacterium]
MDGNSGRKKKPLSEQRQLQATAHHEAGHAVAALHYELKFRYVTIISDEQQGSLGHVKFRRVDKGIYERSEFGALTDRRRMDVERHVITMFTAGAAEARFRGRG